MVIHSRRWHECVLYVHVHHAHAPSAHVSRVKFKMYKSTKLTIYYMVFDYFEWVFSYSGFLEWVSYPLNPLLLPGLIDRSTTGYLTKIMQQIFVRVSTMNKANCENYLDDLFEILG